MKKFLGEKIISSKKANKEKKYGLKFHRVELNEDMNLFSIFTIFIANE